MTKTKEPFCLESADDSIIGLYRKLAICSECDRKATSLHMQKRWNLFVTPEVTTPKCAFHHLPYYQDARFSVVAYDRYKRDLEARKQELVEALNLDPIVNNPPILRDIEEYFNDSRVSFDTESGFIKLTQGDRVYWKSWHLYLRLVPMQEISNALKPYRPDWLLWEYWFDLGFVTPIESLPRELSHPETIG